MTTHTPGPLTLVPSDDGYFLQSATGNVVMLLRPYSAEGRLHFEANARLLAAAPELLAALEELVSRARPTTRSKPSERAYERASLAILKATEG